MRAPVRAHITMCGAAFPAVNVNAHIQLINGMKTKVDGVCAYAYVAARVEGWGEGREQITCSPSPVTPDLVVPIHLSDSSRCCFTRSSLLEHGEKVGTGR